LTITLRKIVPKKLEKQCYSSLNNNERKLLHSLSLEFNMLKKTPPKLTEPQGFSAVELLIVILVIAIIIVLALPQIISSRRLFKFAGVQRQVVGLVREARQEAVAQRTPITLGYDNASKTFTLTKGTFGAPGDSRIVSFSWPVREPHRMRSFTGDRRRCRRPHSAMGRT
jgi:prepilin-type N-terminal cleavage/methylation domain-containing protein